ncbi:MAG: cyclase family protein [Syntrophales bacterium]|nr:cyclase family protein [Syntrophales bacterium]
MSRKRFIDLSIAIESGLPSDPPMMIPKIDYRDHMEGAEQMKDFFPGIKKEQLPGGLGWAFEMLWLTTHSGTHLDAPYHYHPTMDHGNRALTIDEIPLEWCFNDGVVLDFRHMADGERIRVKDIKQELERIQYTIKPLDIVLIQTGADEAWGERGVSCEGGGDGQGKHPLSCGARGKGGGDRCLELGPSTSVFGQGVPVYRRSKGRLGSAFRGN